MYRVLYRKYRPRCFADVIGQPQVTETLKNELMADRIAHAYLFTGSRGTGKTTCSKILSKAVNCLNPDNGDPCGECEICRGIDDGSIMDVVEIDAASNNGVDDIRLLREEAGFTPAHARYRVYIIDEVHMLSIGAFNALLKTLEEPPSHVVFILATTEVHKLPATILSRCQRFDFRRISPYDIADRLMYVCESEKVSIDKEAAMLIAGVSDGAMRDALSLLDQCMSRSEHITEDDVRTTAGLTDKSYLFDLTDAVVSCDASKAVEIVDRLYRDSKDMSRLCTEMCEHFRAMMLTKTINNPGDVLVMPESDLIKTKAQASSMELSVIVDTIEILQRSSEKMFRGINRRIEMEMTLIRLCSPHEKTEKLSQRISERIEVLERAVKSLQSGTISGDITATNLNPSGNSQTRLPPVKKPSSVDMDKLRAEAVPMPQWHDVIEEIKKYSRSVAAGFEGSKAFISGKYVLVDSDKDICFEQLRKPVLRDRMRDAIKQITGNEYKLGRYSYPDEKKSDDDALDGLTSDLKSAGIPVEIKNKK